MSFTKERDLDTVNTDLHCIHTLHSLLVRSLVDVVARIALLKTTAPTTDFFYSFDTSHMELTFSNNIKTYFLYERLILK